MGEGGVGEGYSLQKKWFQETPFRNQYVKETKENSAMTLFVPSSIRRFFTNLFRDKSK